MSSYFLDSCFVCRFGTLRLKFIVCPNDVETMGVICGCLQGRLYLGLLLVCIHRFVVGMFWLQQLT